MYHLDNECIVRLQQ